MYIIACETCCWFALQLSDVGETRHIDAHRSITSLLPMEVPLEQSCNTCSRRGADIRPEAGQRAASKLSQAPCETVCAIVHQSVDHSFGRRFQHPAQRLCTSKGQARSTELNARPSTRECAHRRATARSGPKSASQHTCPVRFDPGVRTSQCRAQAATPAEPTRISQQP